MVGAAGRVADGNARRPGGSKPNPGLLRAFDAALDDDLDTPTALKVIRQAVNQKDATAARRMLEVLAGTASLERA